MSFKNAPSVLHYLSRQMAVSHLCLWPGTAAGGSAAESRDFFSFSFQTDCIALGVRGWWSEAGSGGLIMTPYMAELVNTELSPGRAFPGAEKLPKFFLSPALP